MHGILKANAPGGAARRMTAATLDTATSLLGSFMDVTASAGTAHPLRQGRFVEAEGNRQGRLPYYSLKQLYLMDAIRFFLDTSMSMKEGEPISTAMPPTSSSRPRRRASEDEKQRDVLDARIGIEDALHHPARALLFPKG